MPNTTLPPILTVNTKYGEKQVQAPSRAQLRDTMEEFHYLEMVDNQEIKRVFAVYDELMRTRKENAK